MSLLRSLRPTRVLAAAVAASLATAGLAALAPTADAAEVTVTTAQFRWGFNNESNNKAYLGNNLFSAGKLGNPGSGGQVLSEATGGATWANTQPAGWNAHTGNVYIEKLKADGSYATTSWVGTKTDKSGVPLTSPTGDRFSDHQVVIDNGTGTIDDVANDADLTWDGDFTVVFYSGYTFFYVSDPHLVITNGVGEITATLGGYGADMDDTSQWAALTNTTVTLATLTGVDVTADGLVTTPSYLGVAYTAPPGGTAQVTGGSYYGSFPQDFVDFQQLTGQSSYWYSSGGAADKNKVSLPLTVDVAPGPHVDPPAKSTPVVTAGAGQSTYGKAGTASVSVAPASATGTVTLSGAGAPLTATLANGAATFTLPASLAPGSYALTAAYAGNAQLNSASGTTSFQVVKASVDKPALKVTKKPSPKKKGKAKVTVASPSGIAPSGPATLTLTKGGSKKTVKVTLVAGVATVALPKLAKGTWKATVVFAGSATHSGATSKKYSIKVA